MTRPGGLKEAIPTDKTPDLPPDQEARLDFGYEIAKLYARGPAPGAPDPKIVFPHVFFWLADDAWEGWQIMCEKHERGIMIHGRQSPDLALVPSSGLN